jgi:hypothetical protein
MRTSPIQILLDDINRCYSHQNKFFSEKLKEQIKNGNMKNYINYVCDDIRSKEIPTPFADCANKEITIHERFLEFMWAFIYFNWVFFEEYVLKRDRNKNHDENNVIDLNVIYRARRLQDWAFNKPTDWDTQLPNPEDLRCLSKNEKDYVKSVNIIFINTICIILLHEATHIMNDHYDIGEEFICDFEREADNNAFDIFMDGETDQCKRMLKGISILMAFIFPLFITQRPQINMKGRHLDLDVRLIDMTNRIDITAPKYAFYFYGFASEILKGYFNKHRPSFEDFKIYEPNEKVDTAKELFKEYLKRIEKLKIEDLKMNNSFERKDERLMTDFERYKELLYSLEVRDRKIKPDGDIPIPILNLIKTLYPPQKKLFRYRPCNENNLEALLDDKAFFSRPERFNDPYDCITYVDLNKIGTSEKLEEVITKYCGNISDSDKMEKKRKFIEKYFGETLKTLYIASFSEVFDSMLMWGHYADSHKGFVLEYDIGDMEALNQLSVKQDYTVNLFPVLYDEERYEATKYMLDFFEQNFINGNLKDENNISIPDMLIHIKSNTFKAKFWEYEKEWRLVYKCEQKCPKCELTYPNYRSVELKPKAIYLGSRMSRANKISIKKLIEGKNMQVYEMYADRYSSDKYVLNCVKLP